MNSYISDVAGGIIVDKGQRTNFTEIQYKVKENIKKNMFDKSFKNMTIELSKFLLSVSRMKVRFHTIVWVVFILNTESLVLSVYKKIIILYTDKFVTDKK